MKIKLYPYILKVLMEKGALRLMEIVHEVSKMKGVEVYRKNVEYYLKKLIDWGIVKMTYDHRYALFNYIDFEYETAMVIRNYMSYYDGKPYYKLPTLNEIKSMVRREVIGKAKRIHVKCRKCKETVMIFDYVEDILKAEGEFESKIKNAALKHGWIEDPIVSTLQEHARSFIEVLDEWIGSLYPQLYADSTFIDKLIYIPKYPESINLLIEHYPRLMEEYKELRLKAEELRGKVEKIIDEIRSRLGLRGVEKYVFDGFYGFINSGMDVEEAIREAGKYLSLSHGILKFINYTIAENVNSSFRKEGIVEEILKIKDLFIEIRNLHGELERYRRKFEEELKEIRNAINSGCILKGTCKGCKQYIQISTGHNE